MALATRPKPKSHHKKRQAQHHRKTRLYLKPYWPYLPMAAIIATGAVINHNWYENGFSTTWSSQPLFTPEPVARVQILAGSLSPWVILGTLAITALAFAVFVFRHWYRFHRLLNRGEAFVARHPWFDVAMVLLFTAGYVLTRAT